MWTEINALLEWIHDIISINVIYSCNGGRAWSSSSAFHELKVMEFDPCWESCLHLPRDCLLSVHARAAAAARLTFTQLHTFTPAIITSYYETAWSCCRLCQGDEEKQAGARRGQCPPRRPVWHPAAVVPDETHEEQTAPEGELPDIIAGAAAIRSSIKLHLLHIIHLRCLVEAFIHNESQWMRQQSKWTQQEHKSESHSEQILYE